MVKLMRSVLRTVLNTRHDRDDDDRRVRSGFVSTVYTGTRVVLSINLLLIGVGGINSVAGDHFGARELQANFKAVTKKKGILLFLREGTRGSYSLEKYWGPYVIWLRVLQGELQHAVGTVDSPHA